MNRLLTAEGFKRERRRNQARRSRDRKNCRRKESYPDVLSAETAAKILAARTGGFFAWYQCPLSDHHWHCGKSHPSSTP